jgi:coproporphyrinogen III oxidase-like Fe-S oxidoreductase
MSEISALDQAQEALLMGLRLTEGVAWERVAPAVKETALQDFMEQGLLVRRDGRLWACGDGRLLLNRLIAELAP